MKLKIAAVSLLTALSIGYGGAALAAKDAGLGHDYRTFHSGGKIEYGNIKDSYDAEQIGRAHV